ncbi:MAG: peptidylprolyl isomerase [Flavobacteriales bacterium]
MKQFIRIFFLLNSIILSSQNNVLVKKKGQTYITTEDFKAKFGYTLDHDKTQSKEKILDYYLTMKLKSDEAESLKLNTSPKYINPLVKFIDERTKYYLEEDPFYKKLEAQFIERSKTEVRMVQYFVKNINKNKALQYQKAFSKNKNPFSSKKENVERMATNYCTAGELPYGLEEEIFTNLKKGTVLKMQEVTENQFVYTIIDDIRPYSGIYKFQLLLVKDSLQTGKEKINSLYNQVLKGDSFDQLIKTFSEDEASKNKPFIILKGSTLDDKILSIMNSLKTNEVSKPFKTEFGWNLVKLIEHQTTLNENTVKELFKNSLEYNTVLKGYKINYIKEKLKPVVKKVDIVNDLNNKELITLFKKDSISKNNYEKQLADIVIKKIKKQNIVTFNNELTYTNWNFISDNALFLRMLYKTESNKQKINEKIQERLPVSIAQSEIKLFDNMQDEFNPQFKKEVELLKINILTELYDDYQYDKALKNQEALLKEYEQIKEYYKWDERVEVIVAYCGSDEKTAKNIEQSFKKDKSIKELQQQYSKKNVYFRKIKRELSNEDLPKEYSKEEKIKMYKENGDFFVVKTIAVLPSGQNPSYEELKSIIEKKYQEKFLNNELSKLKKDIQINQNALNNL